MNNKLILKVLVIFLVCFIVLAFNSYFSVVIYRDYIIEVEEGCKSCQMYNAKVKFGINGVYNTDGYYCIWTKDRTEEEIQITELHENCHDLVHKNDDHFCYEDKIWR